MQSPLKLGFFIQPVHPPFRPYADVLREDREAVVLADRLGYREAFIGEHLVDSAETITSSLAFISSLADACPSITFGTGVLPLANYHPAMAAAQVAMVDHLVQGRFILGVGGYGVKTRPTGSKARSIGRPRRARSIQASGSASQCERRGPDPRIPQRGRRVRHPALHRPRLDRSGTRQTLDGTHGERGVASCPSGHRWDEWQRPAVGGASSDEKGAVRPGEHQRQLRRPVGLRHLAWHCDREGRYSMYSSGVTAENYLRGVQATNASGVASFTTVFPGCYAGRIPHMHFEVYRSLATATASTSKIKTSQIAFPLATCYVATLQVGIAA